MFFRFAKWYDVIYMLFGALLAVIAGSCLPVTFFLFGRIISEFSAFTVAQNASAIENYFCNQTLVDKYVTASNATNQVLMGEVQNNMLYIIGVCLILFMTTSASNLAWSVSAINRSNRMRVAFLRAVLNQNISWYDLHPPQQLLTRLTSDIQKIEDGFGVTTVKFIKEFTTVIVGLVIAFILNWKLTLSIACSFPLLLIGIIFMTKVASKVSTKEQSILSNAGEVAESAISAITTVVAFGGEQEEEKRYNNLINSTKCASFTKQFTYGLIYGFFSFMIFAIYGFGLWYGGYLLLDCEITSGSIFTILFEIAGGCLNLNEALQPLAVIATANGAKQYVYSVIDENQSDQSTSNKATLQNINGRIEFSDVLFHYPSRPDVPILKGFDLVIKEGQTVALVGPSGSGKSTVLQVLQQIYIHNGGRITIDGVDVKELDINWLHNQIGIVSQEPVLFNMSISENIGLGKEGATRDEIVEAARAANAYEFIAFLPNGFDTIVGNGGTQLSGGQKQRIAIARALIRNPKILLLDEATSALDTESEKIVQKSLNMAREGRTTIIIAHRLSTIQEADLIVVIDDGRVVELGTHLELINQSGIYSNLIQNQTIDDEVKSESDDFNKAYRQSMRRRGMQRRKTSTNFAVLGRPSISHEPLERRSSQFPFSKRNTAMFASFTRRVSEGLVVVPEAVSPKIFSPHMSSFDEEEEDDVFDPLSPTKISESKNEVSWKVMLKLRLPDKWFLLIGMTGFVLMGIILSSIYFVFGGVVKVYTLKNRDELMHSILMYFLAYLGLGCLSFIIHFVSVLFLGIASDRLTSRLRKELFSAILKQNMSFFDSPEYSSGILAQRLAIDAAQVNQTSGVLMGIAIRGIINIAAGYVIALVTSWPLGLISLSSLGVFILAGIIQLCMKKSYTQSQKSQEIAIQTAVEAVDNVYTITSLGVQDVMIRRHEKQLKAPYWRNIGNVGLQALLISSVQAILLAIVGVSLYVGAVIYNGPHNNNFEGIIRASGATLYTALIFKELFFNLPNTHIARQAASNILEIINTQPQNFCKSLDVSENHDNKPFNIKIANVSFSYPSRPDVPVLQHLTAQIPSGKTVALVGPSGSGKSTIISLMEQFYNVNGGMIFLNERNIFCKDVTWLRRQISLVSQEPVLFDMSISDNIRYGALFRDVTDDEVIEAAKLANIHNFIVTLPQGYDTYVGNKGTQLSGGQKQRIAIARALIRNPKILLLDEATSALDTESEKIVQQSLDVARQGRTTIVIAHRLSTIVNSDNIIVLHKGSVKEQGTHSELMKKRGAYFFMHNVSSTSE